MEDFVRLPAIFRFVGSDQNLCAVSGLLFVAAKIVAYGVTAPVLLAESAINEAALQEFFVFLPAASAKLTVR